MIRFGLLVRTLHPQMFATRFTWRHDKVGVDEAETPHDVLLRTEYLESPYAPILQGVGGVRRRLESDDAELDFPVLKEFKADGATDYVAMPLAFSDGQLNIVTMLTNRAGGFITSDLGQIYEVLPILARLFEIQALRGRACLHYCETRPTFRRAVFAMSEFERELNMNMEGHDEVKAVTLLDRFGLGGFADKRPSPHPNAPSTKHPISKR